MFLADKFLKRARTHSRGQRASCADAFEILGLGEQVVHLDNVTAMTASTHV
jgi:hypothetical protein